MKTTSYSDDKLHWNSTFAATWKWQKELEDCPVATNHAEIAEWLRNHKWESIEYSTDGGYSYVPFRHKYVDEDAGRLFTMQKMSYQIRTVNITEMTNPLAPNLFNRSNTIVRPGPNAQIKTAKRVHYIYREDNDMWNFDKIWQEGSISIVTQHIPMSMGARNTNEVSTSNPNLAIARGHIYKISQNLSTVSQAENDIFYQHTGRDLDGYSIIRSARSFDEETQLAIGEKIYACTILSGKYFVDTNHNPFKIGDTFFANNGSISYIQENIINYGGAVINTDSVEEPKETVALGVIIMKVDTDLEEAVESGDPQKIALALYKALELRNDAVDKLTHLNETIKKARQRTLEMVNRAD